MTDSFPVEIIEDIVSRLPVKTILRCRSVSKTWLNLISGSPFTKLQFIRATESHRTALFFSGEDHKTHKRYYFTAANEGGPLTLIMTVDEDSVAASSGPTPLNGLMCFTSRTWTQKPNSCSVKSQAFVVNPSTRKVFHCCPEYSSCIYMYGFDEYRKEHKILLIKNLYRTEAREFMIFSMSSLSWRKIDAIFPVGFDWSRLCTLISGGVCVNSVVHLLLYDMWYDILAFDFVTEKFSVISLPQRFFPYDDMEDYSPTITKINGCLGVVLRDLQRGEVYIWLLQDYQKRVWANETIKFPKSWNDLVSYYDPLSIDANMDDEIVFCLDKKVGVNKVIEKVISIHVYNMKTKCFKSVQFTLDDQFASSKKLTFSHINCYVETIMPLVDNWSKTSHWESD